MTALHWSAYNNTTENIKVLMKAVSGSTDTLSYTPSLPVFLLIPSTCVHTILYVPSTLLMKVLDHVIPREKRCTYNMYPPLMYVHTYNMGHKN